MKPVGDHLHAGEACGVPSKWRMNKQRRKQKKKKCFFFVEFASIVEWVGVIEMSRKIFISSLGRTFVVRQLSVVRPSPLLMKTVDRNDEYYSE